MVGALKEVLETIDVRVLYTEQVLNYFHVGALFLSMELLAVDYLKDEVLSFVVADTV